MILKNKESKIQHEKIIRNNDHTYSLLGDYEELRWNKLYYHNSKYYAYADKIWFIYDNDWKLLDVDKIIFTRYGLWFKYDNSWSFNNLFSCDYFKIDKRNKHIVLVYNKGKLYAYNLASSEWINDKVEVKYHNNEYIYFKDGGLYLKEYNKLIKGDENIIINLNYHFYNKEFRYYKTLKENKYGLIIYDVERDEIKRIENKYDDLTWINNNYYLGKIGEERYLIINREGYDLIELKLDHKWVEIRECGNGLKMVNKESGEVGFIHINGEITLPEYDNITKNDNWLYCYKEGEIYLKDIDSNELLLITKNLYKINGEHFLIYDDNNYKVGLIGKKLRLLAIYDRIYYLLGFKEWIGLEIDNKIGFLNITSGILSKVEFSQYKKHNKYLMVKKDNNWFKLI